jgi:hypothetical protein
MVSDAGRDSAERILIRSRGAGPGKIDEQFATRRDGRIEDRAVRRARRVDCGVGGVWLDRAGLHRRVDNAADQQQRGADHRCTQAGEFHRRNARRAGLRSFIGVASQDFHRRRLSKLLLA